MQMVKRKELEDGPLWAPCVADHLDNIEDAHIWVYLINNPGHKILESHTNPTQVVWHRGHGESPCLVQQTCLRTSSDLSLNLVMSESNSLGRGFNTLPGGCVAMWRESGLAVDYRLTTGKSLGG